MATVKIYLLVALGGAIGATLRYFVYQLVLSLLGKGFPYATLLVNVLGSMVMGALYAAIEQEYLALVPWRTFIGIGLLGALTTFSTFSMDTLLLLQQAQWVKAGLNIVLNVSVCLLAAWSGMHLVGKS